MPYNDPEKRRKRRKQHKEEVKQREEQFEELTKAITNRRRTTARKIPHLTDLLEAQVAAWGGVAGLVKRVTTEFDESRPGSMQRTKLLESTIRLLEGATRLGLADQPLDLGLLSEADLMREVKKLMPSGEPETEEE